MRRLLPILGFSIALTACVSDQGALTVDAPHFDGLDPAIVAEVVENPEVQSSIDDTPEGNRENLAQGIAINFSVCRDAFRILGEWHRTGEPTELESLPTPTNPVEPAWSDWQRSYADLEARVQAATPDDLREWLTGTVGCGNWIPATPNDPGGATITDVITGW